MTRHPNGAPEPKGNLPERSVAAPKIIWWVLALFGIALFCLLAWLLHNGGGGGVPGT